MKSSMQNCVMLSVTEAELVSATNCAQHILYNMQILESLGLKVKKPMILWMDNKGAIDLANNWSVGGCTRHVDVRYYFLRELKEEGILEVKWIATDEIAVICLPRILQDQHLRNMLKYTVAMTSI